MAFVLLYGAAHQPSFPPNTTQAQKPLCAIPVAARGSPTARPLFHQAHTERVSAMITWLKSNKAAAGFIAFAFALLVTMALLKGCVLGDLIKVKVPANVQRITGSAPVVTLTEAVGVRADAITLQTRAIEQFDNAIQRGKLWEDFLAAGLNYGLVAGQGAAAGFPGGSLIFGALLGAGGLLMRKPGDGRKIENLEAEALRKATEYLERLRKEKEASFNKGAANGIFPKAQQGGG